MTQQLRVAGALGAAIAALMALALPVAILLLLDPASSAACGGTPTGPGPSSVPGVPQRFLPIYEGAAQQYGLGNDGWAYLAALNYAESSFATDNGPGTGVLSGSNYAGAAGPMQIGIGGAATDNWSTVVAQIPPNLPGGVTQRARARQGTLSRRDAGWMRPSRLSAGAPRELRSQPGGVALLAAAVAARARGTGWR